MEKNTEMYLRDAAGALSSIRQEERRIQALVNRARETGATWTEVGRYLDMSKQTAYARYGKDQTSKISDPDIAGTSETPSIFSDDPAPALAQAEATHGKRTVEVFKEFAANQPNRNAAQRQHGRIIEEPYDGMARPGTGKGPQVCKGCGCNNHHGNERGHVYWNDGCKPTKYDTAEETEFLTLVYKENTK